MSKDSRLFSTNLFRLEEIIIEAFSLIRYE